MDDNLLLILTKIVLPILMPINYKEYSFIFNYFFFLVKMVFNSIKRKLTILWIKKIQDR